MKLTWIAALVCATAVAAPGCGESYSAIRTVHPPLGHRKVESQQAAYQFARGHVIEIVTARAWSDPGGEAVPDYEYLYIQVPDTAGTYQVGDAGVVVRRLVRSQREEFLYEATSGTVTYRFGLLTKDHVDADFDVMTRQVWPAAKPERLWPLSGRIKAGESVRDAQGLVNIYGEVVARLLDKADDASGAAAKGH